MTQGLIDEGQDLLAAVTRFRRAGISPWQALAECLHLSGEELDVAYDCSRFDLVGLCEDEDEGDLVFDEPLGELQVDFLWRDAGIDEHKHTAEIGPIDEVVRDKILELLALVARCLGVAIAGKVHQRPFLVDEKEVDEPGPSRGAGNLGEILFAGQGINQG